MVMKNTIQLTQEQEEVVNIRQGDHFIIAPPGSGKTELLSQWIYRLLQEGKKAEDIICLTFTNRAALGMKERIESYYPNTKVFVGNIHHYCSHFLFSNQLISRHKQIIDGEDQQLLFQEIMEEVGTPRYDTGYNHKPITPMDLIGINSWIHQQTLGIEERLRNRSMKRFISNKNHKQIELICEKYATLKEHYHLLDFEDILNLSYTHLCGDISNLKMAHFPWLEVDEVQDLNPLQWEIVEKISQGSTRLYFGDPSQSIFSFMGAKSHIFSNKIQESLSIGGKIHPLSVNFRSPDYLQREYNAFLQQNMEKAFNAQDSISEKSTPPPVMAKSIRKIMASEHFERQYISTQIIPWCLKQPLNQTAILVKTNREATAYGQLMTKNQTPHFMISGIDFFARKEIKDLLALLSVLVDPIDYVSWSRLLSKTVSGLSLKHARRFIKDLQDCGMTPDELNQSFEALAVVRYDKAIKEHRLIVFDTETTGRDPMQDDIIQIAAIEMVGGKEQRRFNRYIQTSRSLAETQEIHHITPEVLKEKGEAADVVLKAFVAFVGEGATVIAHNAPFDIEMLRQNLLRHTNIKIPEWDVMDTLVLCRKLYPQERSYRLEALLERFSIEGENSHNAMDDVVATCNLVLFTKERTQVVVKEAQQLFDSNYYQKIRKAFNIKFIPIYKQLKELEQQPMAFIQLIEGLLGQGKWIDTTLDITKWISHIEHMVEKKEEQPLSKTLAEWVPFYKNCKEVDLYYGKENLLISTIYKAKGLEFDNVIVPGVSNQNFPNRFERKDEKAKAESARLLYVAITRAKHRLVLTYSGMSSELSPFCAPFLESFHTREVAAEEIDMQ